MRDSQARRGMDSSLTWASTNVSALNPPVGEQVWRRQARDALQRDGNSLEGASSPRARRNPARRGAQPSSEAEPHQRGRPALEQGEVLPVWHRHPRAKRSSAQGCPGRLSGGSWTCGFILRVLLGSFVFYFL
jgi:hypothetical protein